MNTPLVSVVVPIYNAERYLNKCIDSIINQTYSNIEIILVNDGSSDSSLEICSSYESDNRVKLINKKNEGLSSARQTGIDAASGDYLCTVDSDDYINNDFIEKMTWKISKESSDICVCETRVYSEDHPKYVRYFRINEKAYDTVQITKDSVEQHYAELAQTYYMSDSWNKIYRLDFIRNSGVRFSLKKSFNGTDLLFNHLLLLHLPKVSVVNEALYNYQVLENSRVRRKDKQLQKGFMIIFNNIIEEVRKLGYSDSIFLEISKLYVTMLDYAASDLFNSTSKYNVLKTKFEEFCILNKEFLHENNKLVIDPEQMRTLSLRTFCVLLIKRNKSSLFLYLNLRQKLFRLIWVLKGVSFAH
ncbi:glycosyltransferase family 2 protein [Mesobacillus maritimus]|uniref:glycosyltransferase family 2 protein n=1 Tax=Mesobacillus maritimus TaxID=1643336 RepID=UPI003851356A